MNRPRSSALSAPQLSRGVSPLAVALVQSIMLAGASEAQAQTATGNRPSGAASASDATKLAEVVVEGQQTPGVSSPKFTEPLRDTPQTVVVIPQEVYTQQGAQNLSDVLRNTPGITFLAGEGGNVASGDSFTMRGFDTSGSIFVDGVRDSGAYSRDTYNLEQVEIAKGPSGADNGRGGASGYINLVTKTPRAESFTAATAVYGISEDGGEDQRRATIDLNQPIKNSPVAGSAVRLNVLWQDSGTPGRDTIDNTSFGVAPSLALGLGTPTRFTLAGAYIRQDNLPDSGLPVIAIPGGAVLPAGVPPVAASVDQSNVYGLRNEDFEHVTQRSLGARLEHDFSTSLRLVNQTRFATTRREALQTYFQNSNTAPATFAPATTPVNPATGAVPPAYVAYDPSTSAVTPRRLRTDTENQIISNQTNVSIDTKTGAVGHTISAGLEVSREEQESPTWSPVGGPSTDLFAPNTVRSSTAAQQPYRAANAPFATAQADTLALYVFDTLRITPRWLLNASIRWENYAIDYESLAPATASLPVPLLEKLKAEGDLWSWKTGLVFKPVRAGSLYVAYGNSFTPPGSGFTLSSTASNQNNPNLDPQEARNLELGAKWEFLQGKVSTSLALYRSENLNVVSTDATTGLVTQDISNIVEGLEFGVSGRITNRWLIFGGLGWMESEFKASGTTSSANDGAGLRYTPRLSGNLWTTYALVRKITIGGGVQYSDSVTRATANAITSTGPSLSGAPSFWLINAMAAYEVSPNLTFRLNITNLADEFTYRVNNNGGRYYPGSPRSYSLTASLKY